MTNHNKWIVTAIVGAQLVAASALAGDNADAIAALKKQIDALSAKVQQLENQHQPEIRAWTAGQPTTNAAPHGGFLQHNPGIGLCHRRIERLLVKVV